VSWAICLAAWVRYLAEPFAEESTLDSLFRGTESPTRSSLLAAHSLNHFPEAQSGESRMIKLLLPAPAQMDIVQPFLCG
jgi:hypothetical protein